MTEDFHMDSTEFAKAFDIVQQATRKAAPDILNKAGLTTIIGGRGVKGAIQRTPRATRGAIKAVPVADVARVVMARARQRGITLTRATRDAAIRREYNRRLSSIAYTAGPGWNNAAIAFGGRGVKVKPAFAKSKARHGSGKLATVGQLVAELTNTAPAADKIGRQALQDALNDTARDMIVYGEAKLQKIFDKQSAK